MAMHYKDLNVWKKATALAVQVYRVTASFPKEEIYGLTQQIRRAAISIPSNIAEGAARDSTREFLRFNSIAQGSLAELETQLEIAHQLNFLPDITLTALAKECGDIGKMLNGLRKKLETNLSESSKKQATDH